MREDTLFGEAQLWVVDTIDDIHSDYDYLEVAYGKDLYASQVNLVTHLEDEDIQVIALDYAGARKLRKLLKGYMKAMKEAGRV